MKYKIAVIFLYLITIMFSDIRYIMAEELHYEWYDEPGGKEYKDLLSPLEKGKWYWVRYKGIGNVDNIDDLEEVVLVTVQNGGAGDYEYEKAFILICKRESDILKIKYLIQIYDKAETKAHQYPPFVFGSRPDFDPNNGRFELVDLNNDGILDMFIKLWFSGGSYSPFYVVTTSFVDGRFERIFSIRAGLGTNEFEIKYADIDGDGLYEIEIPNEITVGFEHASDPTWISLYEWNGKEYVLNDKKFHSRDNDVLIQFLQFYCYRLRWYADMVFYWKSETEMYFEDYEFYLGLIYYYKDKPYRARDFLDRIIKKAKKEDYIREAKIMLEKLQETGNPDFLPR